MWRGEETHRGSPDLMDECLQLGTLLGVSFRFVARDAFPIVVDEGKDRLLDLSRVIVLFLGVAHAILSGRTVFVRYHDNVVITVLYLAFDKIPCLFVR
jgi:hypothetical protein